jgi:guanylate kinase
MAGKLVVLSGLSAAGKTTTIERLKLRGYTQVPSCTTREPRRGEKNGIDYWFFESVAEMIAAKGPFADNVDGSPVKIRGDYFGISLQDIKEGLEHGDVAVHLVVQSALEVEKKMPKVALVYLKTPFWYRVLRMRRRGDSWKKIRKNFTDREIRQKPTPAFIRIANRQNQQQRAAKEVLGYVCSLDTQRPQVNH